MKQTVYIDVLLAVNLFINYFLLLAVSKFLSISVKRGRLLLAALLGATYSLMILLPEFNIALSFLVKLIMAATIVLAAYPIYNFKQFVRELAAFYIMSFAFAGLMLALWYFISPHGLLINNSIVYFDISPLALIVLTVICYFIIRLIHRITGRQSPETLFYRIKIEYDGKLVSCMAKVDTGNTLKEPFSNYPVVVVDKKQISDMIPNDESGKIRLIPFQAVSGGGLLSAFKPDKLTVVSGKSRYDIQNVYVAASQTDLGGASALLNPDLLLQKTSA
ncbi:MAG TPA: sigma-E processing peptidase SpoIIGA [Caproiciproducens sp.]|nr:sigma-E processing peptidase SpoIIGA [Caproiciproducens sp.]